MCNRNKAATHTQKRYYSLKFVILLGTYFGYLRPKWPKEFQHKWNSCNGWESILGGAIGSKILMRRCRAGNNSWVAFGGVWSKMLEMEFFQPTVMPKHSKEKRSFRTRGKGNDVIYWILFLVNWFGGCCYNWTRCIEMILRKILPNFFWKKLNATTQYLSLRHLYEDEVLRHRQPKKSVSCHNNSYWNFRNGFY